MSWVDDFMGWAGGGDTDAALSDVGSDVNFDEIVSGTEDIFAGYDSNNGSPMYGADTPELTEKLNYDGYTTGNGYEDGYIESGGANVNATSESKGIWDKATDFIGDKKNSEILKLGTSFAGGLINRKEKKDADDKAYERMLEKRAYDEKVQKEKEDRADARRGGGSSAMEVLAAKEAIDQANKAKFSNSITGLRPTGLINKGKKLTYVGGKPVYTTSGQLA